jgi:ABC-type transporter Mla subunit MlaD
VRGHLQYRRVMRVVNLVGCCTTVVLALVLAALVYQSTKPFRGNVEVTVEAQLHTRRRFLPPVRWLAPNR